MHAAGDDGGGGAGAVLVARRARGWTVGELAVAADLDESVVRAAERSEPVPPQASAALAAALGLLVDHVDAGAPPALDERHARSVAYLAEVAARSGGTLAVADLAAIWADVGHSPDQVAAIARDEARWRFRVSIPGFVALGASAACLGTGLACLAWSGGKSDLVDSLMMATFLAMLAGIALTALAPVVTWWRPKSVLYRRMTTFKTLADQEGLRGYVVREDALDVLEIRDGDVGRRELLAQGIETVRFTANGPDHVTVTVDHVVGQVRMPWLRREEPAVARLREWAGRYGRGPLSASTHLPVPEGVAP